MFGALLIAPYPKERIEMTTVCPENVPRQNSSILRMLFSLGSAGIFKQSMGARNRVGLGFSYRPARLHRLAELIPWNRFLGSLTV